MKIRNYQPEDYPIIKQNLELEGMFDPIWDGLENVTAMAGQANVIVAEENGGVVGSLFLTQFGSELGFIFRLVVDPRYRKRGIATALLDEAHERLRSRGVKEVSLFVDSGKTELQQLYVRKGYTLGQHDYKAMWRSLL